MAEERLYTVNEVADHLKTTPETVRRWLRSGRLQGIRLGGTKLGYRVSASALERFLDQGKAKAA